MAERNRPTPFQGSPHHDIKTDGTDQYLKIVLPEDSDQVQARNLAPGTYAVNVPQDQIYSVQPRKNSGKFETHEQEPMPIEKDPCCICCFCVSALLMLLFLFLVLGAVLSALFAVLLSPKDPWFSVHGLQFRYAGLPREKPQYELDMEVHNPNPNIAISYLKGGDAFLSSQQLEIASGVFPVFTQKSKNTTAVKMVLTSFSDTLPEGAQSSVSNKKGKVNVTFSLEMKLAVRMKRGLLLGWTMDFNIHCEITVDSLAQETRILSKKCYSRG